MDPMTMLDMERRTGISQEEVDDFSNRMDLISKAMEDIKNGTFDPLKCNIPGYKTLEQEEQERTERVKREEERRKREETRKRKEKQEEHDNWWHKAELRFSLRDAEGEEEEGGKTKSARWANRILTAYKARDANDYSLWDQWVPEDPVSLQEKAEREAELEKLRNREFENNNPDFCSQFKEDMEKRQRSQEEKERTAERLKQKGNRCYKKKLYEDAITSYMEALSVSPFNVAVLANIAQCYLRLERLSDCIEFCTRTLYIDAGYVKALSRRATALHQQKKLKEAADDMRKALALDKENADIVEQHSIIVGDYEDSVTNSNIERALQLISGNNIPRGDISDVLPCSTSSIEELRFSLELLKKMDEQSMVNSHEGQHGQVLDAWVAYDLLLPFMERNEIVRAKFRTSGAMIMLCDRLSVVLEGTIPFPTLQSGNSCREDQDTIVSAMISCAAAAVANTPRNQVVMFKHAVFRKQILAALQLLGTQPSDNAFCSSWIVQTSLLRFLEQVLDSKCWRNTVIASEKVITSLLVVVGFQSDKASTMEHVFKAEFTLLASSICFTLSNDCAGVQAFSVRGVDCLSSVAKALHRHSSAKSNVLLHNLLGFLTNLSTDSLFRRTIELTTCEGFRWKIVQALLEITQKAFCGSTSRITTDFESSERALGALLNLSFTESSSVRMHDLLKFGVVDTITSILGHASSSKLSESMLILSRSISLLCRLHSVCRADNIAKGSVMDQLSSPVMLSKLYAVCEYANDSIGADRTAIPTEMWQLCAQIWCHFGWCAHLTHVREFLHQKQAVPLLIQVIELANAQNAFSRPSNDSTPCERLVGNVVKVLIALQSDHDSADTPVFREKASINALVKALENLSDGLARKNVAILLAKLCQSDTNVKDLVRKLRGIEMMLSISQSLKQRSSQ